MPTNERVATFRITDDLLEGMQLLKDRDGMPYSEQIRRALRPWLEEQGVLKPERKRAGTRLRS